MKETPLIRLHKGAWLTMLGLGIVLSLPGCRSQRQRTVSLMGSTSVQPFAEMLAQEYMKLHPDVDVEVQPGGSAVGIQGAIEGITDIGMVSRSLKDDEKQRLKDIRIARDGLAIVVHPANPVVNVSKQDLQKVYSGQITDWAMLPGGRGGQIRLIMREEGSGTREAFMKLVMGKARVSAKALVQESNGSVSALVSGDSGAIGYMSLGLVGPALKPLSVDGVAPTHQEVLTGKYALVRPFLYVLNRGHEPRPDVQRFIEYVLSPDAQKLLEAEGLVRVE